MIARPAGSKLPDTLTLPKGPPDHSSSKRPQKAPGKVREIKISEA